MLDMDPLIIDCHCGQPLTLRVVLTHWVNEQGRTVFRQVTDHEALAAHFNTHTDPKD